MTCANNDGFVRDLNGIEVEHLLSSTSTRGLVLVRAISWHDGEVSFFVGQMTPADARDIANNLTAAAARAEYEQDLWQGCSQTGMDDESIGVLLHLVRRGEVAREEDDGNEAR